MGSFKTVFKFGLIRRRNVFKEKLLALCIAVCLIVLFAAFTFIGTLIGGSRAAGNNGRTIGGSGNTGCSGGDIEFSRQMGRVSEILESVDGRIAGVQDGLSGMVVYIGQDARDLRGLAERLRVIAARVKDMERDLADARDCIRSFLAGNNTGIGAEVNE